MCPMSRQEGEGMARIIDGKEMNLVGDKVKEFRKAKKLSQQAVSDKL